MHEIKPLTLKSLTWILPGIAAIVMFGYRFGVEEVDRVENQCEARLESAENYCDNQIEQLENTLVAANEQNSANVEELKALYTSRVQYLSSQVTLLQGLLLRGGLNSAVEDLLTPGEQE